MKEFIAPKFEIVSINKDDVIATSGCMYNYCTIFCTEDCPGGYCSVVNF